MGLTDPHWHAYLRRLGVPDPPLPLLRLVHRTMQQRPALYACCKGTGTLAGERWYYYDNELGWVPSYAP